MNRRTFLTTPAAIAATPKPAHTGGKSPMFFGRWGVPMESLVHASGNRWHVANDEHSGPVVLFTRGHIPSLGDPVLIHINADTCLRRGFGNHRHRTKIILRVKPIRESDIRPEQGTLSIVQYDPCIDRAYRIAGDWWLVDDGGEPREKYDPPVLPPAPPEWFSGEEDLGIRFREVE